MEKTNLKEEHSWHIGVDELERLPGGLNPVDPGSWQRLENRLQLNESKKRISFYWVAAALIVTFIILRIGIGFWHQPKTVPEPFNTNTVSAPDPANLRSVKQAPSIVQPPSKRVEKFIVTNKPAIRHPEVSLQKQPQITIDTIISLPPNLTVKIDTNLQSVADHNITPPRRSIGVLHINDLVETIETTPGMTMKVKPFRRYIRGTREEEVEKAAVTAPVKERKLNKPSTIQN